MAKKSHNRSLTPADLEAARRLKALWDAAKGRRPTQEEMAVKLGGSSQSLTSQYINGLIALNYKAVLAFAGELGCPPEAIRHDLPEQALARRSEASQSARGHVGIINSRREALGLSALEVWERLKTHSWPKGVSAPDPETVGRWFQGTEIAMNRVYQEALYAALEMDLAAASKAAPIEAKTAVSQEMLSVFERLPPGEQESLLAYFKSREGQK